jgi:hypothetical protein
VILRNAPVADSDEPKAGRGKDIDRQTPNLTSVSSYLSTAVE